MAPREARTISFPSHTRNDLSGSNIDGLIKKARATQHRTIPSILGAAALLGLLPATGLLLVDGGYPVSTLTALFSSVCLLSLLLLHRVNERDGISALQAIEFGWKETQQQLKEALAHSERIADAGKRSIRSRSDFLVQMSHELRMPLSGAIGMARLLLGTELTVEQREYAEAIQNRAESLLQTITDILDFSKIEAGKMAIEIIPFDLRVTMDDIIDIFSLQLHEKRLELITLIHPEIPSLIKGDPGRLRQILINLIGNAVKFTENGEISLKIDLQSDDGGNGITLRFSVADTGIGIPEEQMETLFDPYQQADASIARKYGGTGLGLAIAKQLVECMGGAIGVESTEGVGSTFWFTAVMEKQTPHEIQVHKMAPDIQGVPVLVVDDNTTNRRMLRELLTHWGCHYDEAAAPDTALHGLRKAAAAGRPARIVILGTEISGTSGEALGARILGEPSLGSPRLIMITALGSRGDAARLETVGFSAYLTKPIKQCQLLECLLTLHGNPSHLAPQPGQKILTRYTIEENRRRRLRILLVEDDAVNRKVTLTLLERLGFLPDTATNGRQALSALDREIYDLILMDCVMPVLNGFDTTREIRKRNALKQIPVIAMTAHSVAEIERICLECGMNDWISKPVSAEDLARMIDKWTQVPDTMELLELPQIPVPMEMIFDKEALIQRVMGDENFARELVVEFLQDLPRRRALLKSAILRREAEAVRQEAHSLKGVSTNLSAPALREISSRIEAAAATGKTETTHHLMRELDSQIQHFKNALILSKLISLHDC